MFFITYMNNYLLSDLAQKCGCTYFSDLHCKYYRRVIYNVLVSTNYEQYPKYQWYDAAGYILGVLYFIYQNQSNSCKHSLIITYYTNK